MSQSPRRIATFCVLSLAALVASVGRPSHAARVRGTRAAADTAIFAGGCYWTVESMFEHVKGVRSVVSGFARGGAARQEATEAVRVVYDPSAITYDKLLELFFLVVHDPTQVDRQGPDVGAEYRSALFYLSDAQKRHAQSYLTALGSRHAFPKPIATTVEPLAAFHEVPPDQQDFVAKHPTSRYVVINDVPKLAALKAKFPSLWKE